MFEAPALREFRAQEHVGRVRSLERCRVFAGGNASIRFEPRPFIRKPLVWMQARGAEGGCSSDRCRRRTPTRESSEGRFRDGGWIAEAWRDASQAGRVRGARAARRQGA